MIETYAWWAPFSNAIFRDNERTQKGMLRKRDLENNLRWMMVQLILKLVHWELTRWNCIVTEPANLIFWVKAWNSCIFLNCTSLSQIYWGAKILELVRYCIYILINFESNKMEKRDFLPAETTGVSNSLYLPSWPHFLDHHYGNQVRQRHFDRCRLPYQLGTFPWDSTKINAGYFRVRMSLIEPPTSLKRYTTLSSASDLVPRQILNSSQTTWDIIWICTRILLGNSCLFNFYPTASS